LRRVRSALASSAARPSRPNTKPTKQAKRRSGATDANAPEAFQNRRSGTEVEQSIFLRKNIGLFLKEKTPTKALILLVINDWWLRPESNRRHKDFQSSALPTELPSHPERAVIDRRKMPLRKGFSPVHPVFSVMNIGAPIDQTFRRPAPVFD
jgi:hypothetical protein